MGSPIDLHWLASPSVSCLHAALTLVRGQTLADPALADALAEPVAGLQTALDKDYVPAEALFAHLLPLAAGGSVHEAAETALVKTLGRAEAAPRVSRLRAALAGLIHACASALPELEKTLPVRMVTLRQTWNYHGAGLLAGLQNCTEPGILVEEATAVVVHPALGGGGEAYPPYNAACIEAVAQDPVALLPEVLRLAWLLSLLNLDLPRYSEQVPAERLPLLAGLAMLPPILASAETAGLAGCDEPTVALAIESWLRWLPAGADSSHWPGIINEWWSVYCNLRSPWPAALQALDRLLKASVEPAETGDKKIPESSLAR
jgi:hypothetical protein